MFIGSAIVELMKESEWYTTLVQQPRENQTAIFSLKPRWEKQEEYAASATSLCQATPGLYKNVNKVQYFFFALCFISVPRKYKDKINK